MLYCGLAGGGDYPCGGLGICDGLFPTLCPNRKGWGTPFRLWDILPVARKGWATRQGWLFITSPPEFRERLRPLVSMWLDMLVLRMMNQGKPGVRPVWFILDELQSLHALPQLHTAITESRKVGNPVVLGFQGRSQLEELYGRKSEPPQSVPTRSRSSSACGEVTLMEGSWTTKQTEWQTRFCRNATCLTEDEETEERWHSHWLDLEAGSMQVFLCSRGLFSSSSRVGYSRH